MFFGLFLLSNARPKMWSGVMRLEFQIEFTGRPSGFIVELFSLKSSVLKLVVYLILDASIILEIIFELVRLSYFLCVHAHTCHTSLNIS